MQVMCVGLVSIILLFRLFCFNFLPVFLVNKLHYYFSKRFSKDAIEIVAHGVYIVAMLYMRKPSASVSKVKIQAKTPKLLDSALSDKK